MSAQSQLIVKHSSSQCNIENVGSDCKTPMTGGGLKYADSYIIAKKAALAVAKMKGGRCEDIVAENERNLLCR